MSEDEPMEREVAIDPEMLGKADRSQAQGETIAERAEAADQKRENPSALHSCWNVGDLFERADRPDR